MRVIVGLASVRVSKLFIFRARIPPCLRRVKQRMLYPTQNTDEKDQTQDIEDPNPADDLDLSFETFHVKNPESDNEEDQVTEQEDQPRRATIPPGIIPGQRSDGVEQIFHEDAKSRTAER